LHDIYSDSTFVPLKNGVEILDLWSTSHNFVEDGCLWYHIYLLFGKPVEILSRLDIKFIMASYKETI